jgi:hypothetical protein
MFATFLRVTDQACAGRDFAFSANERRKRDRLRGQALGEHSGQDGIHPRVQLL